MTIDYHPVAGSFRDPAGFLFIHDGAVYRQVNRWGQVDYDTLMESGLYAALVSAGLLLPHEEVALPAPRPESAYRVLRPVQIPFISYPYEWCFSQLRDAALLTLQIQKRAFDFGMSLKDSSAYNIQFYQGRPVLIDTLSFEPYHEGQPWVAYRQFCQHFLAPLALMAHRDSRLSQFLRVYMDGLPLDLAVRLLPWSARFQSGLLFHIYMHSRSQQRYAGATIAPERAVGRMNRIGLLGLLDSLETAVKRLRWREDVTEWGDYYDKTNYTAAAHEHKKALIAAWLEELAPRNVWDLGANTGVFSRLASARGISTVAFDVDPGAIEQAYRTARLDGDPNFLPLLLDLTNPSPALGWHSSERQSWLARGPVDMVLALALVHHLAIANNVPLPRLAEFFSHLGEWLVLEFVPKEDSQVQKLLATREDIFVDYSQSGLEAAFAGYFAIEKREPIAESCRTLYLMRALPYRV
ncbi:MAG: Methyltransferase domain protein [Chloroflexi bacterium ADurb.Bin360]|nr:MAG: Methyltransferase domain protein [Chloroflexi bacterium ADurb.Bin360]